MSSDTWLATPWTSDLPAPRSVDDASPLAFVSTDHSGVINDLNDVFIEWTRFARSRLVGTPHSVVRHPGMPAGLFQLLWQRLEAGQPVCAYLQNLPADGNTYTALVTISPTADGYLAVQQRPSRPEAAEAMQKIYTSVRAVEFDAQDDGQPAEAVTSQGAALLVDLMRQLGFSSFDDFMWTALPQEVDEHTRRAPGPLTPVMNESGRAADIVAASRDLARELLPWSEQQAELLRTWGILSKTLVSLKPTMDEANRVADSLNLEVAQESSFHAMRLSITVWASMVAEIEKIITDLPNDLLRLRQACAETRFWIGLSQIHAEMVGQVASGLAEVEALEASRAALSRLCHTLSHDFDELIWRMEKNSNLATTVAERIQSLHDLMVMPRDLIENWKSMTAGREDEFVTRLLPEVDSQLSLADQTLTLLRNLAQQCQTIAVVQPMDTARRCVRRVQRALEDDPTPPVVPELQQPGWLDDTMAAPGLLDLSADEAGSPVTSWAAILASPDAP
ncbi:MAG: PAS domain-containing protein [Propionibacteriaceae bacterium]|nr:PAS domain-containing protein [Propionibacteriaceae bacterium]